MKFMRFEYQGKPGFGVLEAEGIVRVYEGDMFNAPQPTSTTLPLREVALRTPCQPGKMIALWNNSRVQIETLKRDTPKEVLWFLKPSSSFITHGQPIIYPTAHTERVVLEGELGIVIGRPCSYVSEAEAPEHIFGYCCINDVTAADLIGKTPAFPQWTRAKSFDGFGAFGPAIATGLDPMSLRVRTVLDGQERQNYPVSDMIFPPAKLVALLSQDMTLMPGDVIACGTSVGVGTMKNPSNTVEISIGGVGTLSNNFTQ